MDGKFGTFTLILNQITGVRKVVDKAPEGATVDLVRLKTKFPSIAASVKRIGIKLTLKAGKDKKTGADVVKQHRNECVEFQCLGGVKDVKHSYIPDGDRSTKGAKAAMTTFDFSAMDEEGKPVARCTNLVMKGKGDEFLSKPLCDDCKGTKEEGGSSLPEDILGALGLDINDVS